MIVMSLDNPHRDAEELGKDKHKINNKLEDLLSKFCEFSSEIHKKIQEGDINPLDSIDLIYRMIYENLDVNNYTLSDIEKFARYKPLYMKFENDIKNNPVVEYSGGKIDNNELAKSLIGFFISAIINKKKWREKIHINSPIPINNLFYKSKGIIGYVNKAGYFLGWYAEYSKIYAGEAGDYAGAEMDGSELHVIKAGRHLGKYAKNSIIYYLIAADEGTSGSSLGDYTENTIYYKGWV
ncbi:MAG: hypothetical protein ACP5MT_03125 [Candidatus Acidifodinimicrobium sp.]